MADQTAELEWRDGRVPVSTRFEDPYFSIHDGLEETRHVFLAGNDLPARFGGAFAIAELGFGTGLNFLVAWDAWETAGGQGALRFTSFEAFPMALRDMETALAAFPALAARAARLLALWQPGAGPVEIAPGVTLEVLIGDARLRLPQWKGVADAWFLDGFAPARNPELWEPELLQAVHDHTAPGGTLATYTAAGAVRRALEATGFTVTRAPGFGRKRHMTTGRRDG